MRHLLIGLIALVIFLMLVLYASAKTWGADPNVPAARDAPSVVPTKLSPRSRFVFDMLYSGRTRINPVQKQLIREGYGVAGKLPILPEKRDTHIQDAAGNVLPSTIPRRNLSGPLLGTERIMRDPLMRNRLSAGERTQQQLFRGPSAPGMIAPRAQQARTAPSARDLGR